MHLIRIAAAILPLIPACTNAADIITATGFFKTNAPATITATPLAFFSGAVPDTSYEFTTGPGDSVAFTLPVGEAASSIRSSGMTGAGAPRASITPNRLLIDAGASMAYGTLVMTSLSGREISRYIVDPTGHCVADISGISSGVYLLTGKSLHASFTARMTLAGGVNQIRFVNFSGTYALRGQIAAASDSTASYRIDIRSNSVAFNDTTGLTVSLSRDVNGVLAFSLSENASDLVSSFTSLLDSATYEKLFPKRFGLGLANSSWDTSANPDRIPSDGTFDFYTYRSLLAALNAIGDVRVEIWNRAGGGADYAVKLKWFNKKTGVSKEFITHDDYNAEWNLDLEEIKTGDVDFAKFCSEGDLSTRKRELAAFLANISHETTGMGSEEPKKIWGLYWREEVAWQNGGTDLGYIDNNSTMYPPEPGKSYHGRGPIQISWNTNYGQVSEFLFGDKNILLKQPELVLTTDSDGDGVADAMLAFQTAIWFWMYPQAPKPSCHDVMVGNWQPTTADIAAGRDLSRFGMTINVINGGQECGKGDGLSSPLDRIGFYKAYAAFMGVPVPDGEYCDCGQMQYMQ